MQKDDHSYLAKRAAQERDRADRCADNSVAWVHLQMADEYERRAARPEISLIARQR